MEKTDAYKLDVTDCKDQVGGGSAPTVRLSGQAVAVFSDKIPAERLERLMRKAEIPVIVRVAHDEVLLSVRTIKESEFESIANALQYAAGVK